MLLDTDVPTKELDQQIQLERPEHGTWLLLGPVPYALGLYENATSPEERASWESTAGSSLSTELEPINFVDEELRRLLRLADPDNLEETNLGSNLEMLVRSYGIPVIGALHDVALKGEYPPEVIGEALTCLGEIDDEATYTYRRWLLETALAECESFYEKDGANQGLAAMDDPHAIPAFEEALRTVRTRLLGKVLKQTLNQLQEASLGTIT